MKKIFIKVIYDFSLKKIIGKYAERIEVPSGFTSLDFINFLLKKYPRISKEVPPSRFGFECNGKRPSAGYVLKDGDKYEFCAHSDDGGYEFIDQKEIQEFYKKAQTELDKEASKEEIIDRVSNMVNKLRIQRIVKKFFKN
ncbi:hypothetical protein COT82_02615 [Candidatus Campbellbacteria bacterium CG10_big_fil_rev_8_21_14_0_10_35_52]|uniref:Uncharacterized protein n=1 Tax=Candidatus Campbellbacteria bacterium CG10_big_fil_rev_8_21_14_0_10_35_52 TaxID=1974527 RepID=A0A2M6WUU5_9BACT|nr:MAG: hypothetical protein COT82_02615 [Candidatus Campbellbacteria bacterium CG10_big_fil_rev_8_21_14_0_10_35_52]